ncbi:hypothetical protein BASA62_007143 [Batrachochytrium salamandrivorans]|nr:hypothetical protein BASA62_007143 [Batrachochytrium salamandrivorans]
MSGSTPKDDGATEPQGTGYLILCHRTDAEMLLSSPLRPARTSTSSNVHPTVMVKLKKALRPTSLVQPQLPNFPLTKEENEKIDKIYSKLYVEIFGVRNPVSDKFDEIRDLKNLMQEVEEERGEKSPSELVEVDAALAEAKEVLADLEKELEVLEAERIKRKRVAYLGNPKWDSFA